MIADYFVSDLPPPPPEAYEEEHIGHQSKTFRLLEQSINSGGTLSSLSWDIYIYMLEGSCRWKLSSVNRRFTH
jgi:hypothetical protein